MKKKQKNKYKLRAEGGHDIELFIYGFLGQLHSFKMMRIEGFPDVEFEFETTASIPKIRSVLKTIPDSHVMLDTVALHQQYTGERTYIN